MSDLHAWPSTPAVAAAFAKFAAHRDRLRALVDMYAGDEARELRSFALAELFAIDRLERDMRACLAGPVVVETPARREVGMHTREGLKRIRQNRGHQ